MEGFTRRRDISRQIAAVVATLLLASTAAAQDWAVKMFDHTSHDFGAVARGAKVEHIFTIENIYEEPAEIESIRSSCGCTSTQLTRNRLETWQKAALTAAVDTRNFLGQKDSTITVVFSKPFPAEVQLQVHCYIRSDVVVQPGSVQFGSVRHGETRERDLTISYAGRDDWRIERVLCDNTHVDITLNELGRNLGQVTYALKVQLRPDAPVGYINDLLTLVTNDDNPRAARVPIEIEGVVTSAVTVRPSPLMLGVLQPGATVTRQVVVHGELPFRVTRVESDDPRISAAGNGEAKKVHVIPVTFTADNQHGQTSAQLRISTDAEGAEQLTVDVQALLVGQPAQGARQ
jgi:hypothetical protein